MKNVKEYMDRIEMKYGSPYIQIPKNLIRELSDAMNEEDSISYLAYANGLMIVNGFLYKYAHYIDLDHDDSIGMGNIKELLKYNPSNQALNKVSKKGGILDNNGFLEFTTDIPLRIVWESKRKPDSLETRKVITISDEDFYLKEMIYEKILPSPNYRACIPSYMIDYGNKKGTLNDYKNTYTLTYSEFKYFLFNDNMTIRDLLFYCYLKSIQDKDGCASQSRETIQKYTGMSHVTVKKISDKLSKHKIITVSQEQGTSQFSARPKKYQITKSFNKKMNIKKKSFVDNQKTKKNTNK